MTNNSLTTLNDRVNQPTADDMAEGEQFLTFELGDELYGVEILKVQEIRGWSEPTIIPNAPHFIRGVINLRGAIVPILDLRRRFEMEETEFTPQTVVIVVNVQDRTIGMVVDAVSDVVDFEQAEIRNAPDFGATIDASFIRGLSPHEERMVILLHIDKLLAKSELLNLDNLAVEAAE